MEGSRTASRQRSRHRFLKSRSGPDSHRMQQPRTGTGGACAPLSEILPSARVARFVRMTEEFLRLLSSGFFLVSFRAAAAKNPGRLFLRRGIHGILRRAHPALNDTSIAVSLPQSAGRIDAI